MPKTDPRPRVAREAPTLKDLPTLRTDPAAPSPAERSRPRLIRPVAVVASETLRTPLRGPVEVVRLPPPPTTRSR